MTTRRAYLFPFFAILFWAGNVVVSKMAASQISPTAITFYRLILALSIMSLFVLVPTIQNYSVIRIHWPKLALGGLLSVALFQSLSYHAASTTTATNMAIVTALIPLLTIVLSSIILKEKVSVGMVVGGALSLFGLLYLVSQGQPGQLMQQGIHLGDGLMLIAASGYALYSVLLKHWKMNIPAWQSTYVQALFAFIYMLPLFLMVPNNQARLDASTIPLILYAGIFSSVLLSYLWIEGVRHLGPNRNSIFMNLLPLLTALAAIILLNEKLHVYHLIGGTITLVGIVLAQTVKRPVFAAKNSCGSPELSAE